MLFFIQKHDGTIIHNVLMVQKFRGSTAYYVTTGDGFGKKDADVKEIPQKEVSMISTYEYVNKGMK